MSKTYIRRYIHKTCKIKHILLLFILLHDDGASSLGLAWAFKLSLQCSKLRDNEQAQQPFFIPCTLCAVLLFFEKREKTKMVVICMSLAFLLPDKATQWTDSNCVSYCVLLILILILPYTQDNTTTLPSSFSKRKNKYRQDKQHVQYCLQKT